MIYFLSYRSRALWTFYANHPDRLPSIQNIDYEIKFADTNRNCEDAILDEKNGVAILSCDPGRDKWNTIMVLFQYTHFCITLIMGAIQGTFVDPDASSGTLFSYKYADSSAVPTPLKLERLPTTLPKALHPLGVGFYPPTRALYMVSHAHPTSLLVFKLSSDGTSATFQRQISHPLLQTPNSVCPISDHELYITNDHAFKIAENPFIAKLETYLAFSGGSVVYYDLKTDEAKKVASLPFANGVALLPGGKLAVASTSSAAVAVYNINPSTHALTLNLTLKTPHLVDNLKADSSGTLLIAGHPHGPSVSVAATQNRFYDLDGSGDPELKPENERPRAGSWVQSWDGNAEGVLRDLYAGMEFGGSTTAVRDVERNLGIVTGLYEKGIMVWKDRK